jgi:ring-1,2-phenylacetyl-CoA epoxidase subunit PaaC
MTDETAYTALNDDIDDHRWAYGTGFENPLSGVDTTVPDGVDGADLAAYCLMLGDDALLLSQRLQEWVTRLPELEEETALANIALDLLGQARLLLSRAGSADGSGRGEDAYAFERAPAEFRHVGLVAETDDDFGRLIARLTVFTIWRLVLFERLRDSRDPVLAAIADHGVKELRYHLEYAGQWLIRLGDGTDLSHRRSQQGLDLVAQYLAELFTATEVEDRLAAAAIAVSPASVRDEFDAVLERIVGEATLVRPQPAGAGRGRRGAPSPAGDALIEHLQSVARMLPGATW